MGVILRTLALAVALVTGAVALPGGAPGGGISDIVSDFLYYQEELKVKAPARPASQVVAGIGQRYLGLVDDAGGVRVWDLETGAQVAVEGRRPSRARAVFPSERAGNLVVVEADGRVWETAGMSFALKGTLLGAGAASDAVAVSPRAPVLAAAGGGRLQVYNLATRRTVAVPLEHRVTGLWVSEDGRFVAYEAASVAWVLDTDSRTSLPLEPAGPAGRLHFYHDAAGAPSLARQEAPTRLALYTYDGQGFARRGNHTFTAAPEGVWIHRGPRVYWARGNTLAAAALGAAGGRTLLEAKEPIVYVRPVKSDDLLVAYRSGVLGVVSGRTGKVVATALGTENGWAVIDAGKRYDGSASGSREIAWVVQKTDLDLEKFARHFFEPGLLLHYVGQQPLSFASAGHQGPIPLPPSVSEVKLLENVANTGRTVVLATARNVKDEVAGIEVYHNGKRVSEAAKITENAARRDDLRFLSAGYQIHPVPGPNTVAVMGVGRLGIEGPTRDLSFERPGTAGGALHVVTVGIDTYALPALRLGYARRDAEAIARLLRTSRGFDRVALTELHDAAAPREAVLGALRGVAAAAAPGDTIVVYLAGHGIAFRGGWYFLSPAVSEVEPEEIVRLSASAEQITGALRESRASRIVLMIDACNSGAVVRDVKGLVQNRVYTQLGRVTGFVVLAASRQDQGALERATLGHGVFTAATVSALSGSADRNGDGRVTARELAAYISRQIPTLATEHLNEIQIPVAYAPSEDFVVRTLR